MWDNLVSFMTTGESLVFIIISIFVIGGALTMISSTRIIHMVLALAVTFIGLAAIFILLEAEFVGFVQILVYGGAITILMLFGIMMTKHESEEEDTPKRPAHNTLLFLGVVAVFAMMFFAIQGAEFPAAEFNAGSDNTHTLGELIFTKYVIPFELVSVLLTVAFIGAIALAKREEE